MGKKGQREMYGYHRNIDNQSGWEQGKASVNFKGASGKALGRMRFILLAWIVVLSLLLVFWQKASQTAHPIQTSHCIAWLLTQLYFFSDPILGL